MKSFIATLTMYFPFYAAVLLLLLYLYYELYRSYWNKRNVPVLRFTTFYKTLINILLMRVNIGETLKQLYEENKTPFLGLLVINQPILILNDPDVIKEILVSDFSNFSDHTVPYRTSSDMIGTSTLFTTKNPTWKLLRSKLSPFFSSGKLKQMICLMNDVAGEFRSFIAEENKSVTHTETKEMCAKYATDVISSCAFGVNSHCFHHKNSEFRTCAKRLVDWTKFIRRFSFSAYFVMPSLAAALRLKFWDPISAAFLKTFFWQSVKEREKSNFVRHDLVDMLIKVKNDEIFMKGENIDEDLVAAQAVQFFGAGFETVATTITLTIYEVSKNALIQNKVTNEVISALETYNGCNYDSINNMKYLDKCVKETLRKYPPMPFVDRVCLERYNLPNSKAFVEKGNFLMVPLMGLHYDPDVFPDPERYDPERFQESDTKSAYGFSYLPFGGGPRSCIGERFGLLAVKVALTNIFGEFRVEPTDKTPERVILDPRGATVTPLEDLHLKYVKLEKPYVFDK